MTMTDSTLSLNDSLLKRIMAWSDERFPFAHAIAFFSLYITAAAVARYSAGEAAINFSLLDIAACFLALSYFLVLRVFDEHKDYELDCMNHPQRVLQSGMITLKHLKGLAVVSVVAQLLFSLWQDRGFADVSIAWAIAFTWTCLMGVEFFCGEWLEKRLTLYAFSHMLVTPMIMWWLAQMAAPSVAMSTELILLLCFAFVGGFTAEIVRKTRGPEEERDTVDSYSKIFGTQGSAWVVMVLLSVTGLIQAALCQQMSTGNFIVGYLVLAAAYVLAVVSLLKFIKAPSLKGREKNEAFCGLAMLIGYFVVIAAALLERGISFSLLA